MVYKINEIFYSIQAEGNFAGNPAIFVRFSGCNLKCPWCDTNHLPYIEMTGEEINQKVNELADNNTEDIIVVFTGGEPTLQLTNEEELCPDYYRTIETNGLLPVPTWVDWVTCSPKTDTINIKPNELKFVFDYNTNRILRFAKDYKNILYFIQPLEENGKMNIKDTIDFVLKYPLFKFSLQYHKIIGIQ